MYPSVPWTNNPPPPPPIPVDDTMDHDSETDSETVSSLGNNNAEYSDIVDTTDQNYKAEQLFWAYQRAKGRWRKFMNKPNRRVRRFFKRKGKGKGKLAGVFSPIPWRSRWVADQREEANHKANVHLAKAKGAE